jgi:hypothetical protein
MIVTFKKIILDNPITVRTTRGELCRLGERSLGFRLGWWSDRCWSVKGAETASGRTARKGCGDVEGPKRVRLEEESRKSEPRRRGADLRIPDGRFVETKRRSAESASTPGFRRPPWARGSPRGT